MGQLFSPSAPILNETESWKLHLQFAPQATLRSLACNRQVEKSVSVIPFFKIGEVVFGTGM